MGLIGTIIAACAILGLVAFIQVQGLRRELRELARRVDGGDDGNDF